MNIAIVKEITAGGSEQRAVLLPKEVERLVEAGHAVFVEKGLGAKIFVSDEAYREAGAKILSDRKALFRKNIVVKIKPPLPSEFRLLKNNLLFSMLHAEQNPHYVGFLRKQNAKAIAMELIKNRAGERLIHCTDMAGQQGMIMVFHRIKKTPAECAVLVLGYGMIAAAAAQTAFNLGAHVKILRRSEFKYIRHFVRNRDIVVNGLSWPKEYRDTKRYLITKEMLKLLHKGAIILDLSVDYPNPVETCHPTLLNKPAYRVNGIEHISIFGYPGLVPISSSRRYSRQVLPILLKIASVSWKRLPAYLRAGFINPQNCL